MADGRDAPHATFVRPDLGSFCRLDELGLQVVGQRIEPGRAVLACRVIETDEFARWCRRCGCDIVDSLDEELQRPKDRVGRSRRCHRRISHGAGKPDPPTAGIDAVQRFRHVRVVIRVRRY
jgi:hypothetical protein